MELKKDYKTLEEVFDALPQSIKEHSLRVEKYAVLIFLELCASEEYTMNINSRVRLRAENRSLIGLAARYHDLGKALVPEIYQNDSEDFSQEERALYRRHCLAGDELVHNILQAQPKVLRMTVDVIGEGVLTHHERWDGDGYPNGMRDEQIPIVGRIVRAANDLDHYLMRTRTENPVQTALESMMRHSVSRYDPVITGLLYEAKGKLEKLFALYREQSRAVAPVPRIIKRRTKRPMRLIYRPITDIKSGRPAALEAMMQFKRGREYVPFAEAEHLLREGKNMWEAGFCFLVEATDMARRMRICEVGGDYVLLPTVTGFLKKRGAANQIIKMLTDTELDPSRIAFILCPPKCSKS